MSLGTGGVATAHAINNRGQVVGQAENDQGLILGFVWTPETGMQTLPSSNFFGEARSINSDGLIVGLINPTPIEATLWNPN